MSDTAPIYDLAGKFQTAFAFFNAELFLNRLPPVIITTQRHRGAAGFFSPDSYNQRQFDEQKNLLPPEYSVHEIDIMPDAMYDLSDREVLSTLCHEMVHLQQHEEGKPSRGGYHNREWADLMKEIGLEPSSFGKYDVRNPDLSQEEKERSPGEGKPTGQKMSHYIIRGGRFDAACAKLLVSGFSLDLQQCPVLSMKAPKSKLKYTCPNCHQKTWAKSGAKLICGFCNEIMNCEEESDED